MTHQKAKMGNRLGATLRNHGSVLPTLGGLQKKERVKERVTEGEGSVSLGPWGIGRLLLTLLFPTLKGNWGKGSDRWGTKRKSKRGIRE